MNYANSLLILGLFAMTPLCAMQQQNYILLRDSENPLCIAWAPLVYQDKRAVVIISKDCKRYSVAKALYRFINNSDSYLGIGGETTLIVADLKIKALKNARFFESLDEALRSATVKRFAYPDEPDADGYY